MPIKPLECEFEFDVTLNFKAMTEESFDNHVLWLHLQKDRIASKYKDSKCIPQEFVFLQDSLSEAKSHSPERFEFVYYKFAAYFSKNKGDATAAEEAIIKYMIADVNCLVKKKNELAIDFKNKIKELKQMSHKMPEEAKKDLEELEQEHPDFMSADN